MAGLWGSAASHQQAVATSVGYGQAINAAGDVGMVIVAPAGGPFQHYRAAAGMSSPDDPMFPFVAAAQRVLDGNAAKPSPPGPAIHFWQAQPPQPPPPTAAAPDGSPGKKALNMMDYGRGRADSGGSGSGGTSCYDCGNQAKKGCAHNRCRTCCNSRGFDCDTHVKSTWVTSAGRRDRQKLAGAGGSPPSPAPTTAKKPRVACQANNTGATNSCTSTSNATTPRSFETSLSHHQDALFRGSLPRHVRWPAVFRCVQVTSVDDGQREVAYQTAVTINGHRFRGLLYDLGAEDGRATSAAARLGSSDLHLASASAATPDLYGGGSAPLILGGLGYGNAA